MRGALLLISLAAGWAFTLDVYSSGRQKLDSIEGGKLRAGTRVELSWAELNELAVHEAPEGVRNPKFVAGGRDIVTGSALVDFGKLRRGQGYHPGWLMSRLLDGERPVKATARVQSGAGKVTVEVTSAEISGVEIDGRTLDFLLQNFVLPFYPEAMVGRPVEMGFNIDRVQLAAGGVGVTVR